MYIKSFHGVVFVRLFTTLKINKVDSFSFRLLVFDRTVGVVPRLQENYLYLLKCVLVVVGSGEVLVLPGPVFVLVRY